MVLVPIEVGVVTVIKTKGAFPRNGIGVAISKNVCAAGALRVVSTAAMNNPLIMHSDITA